MKLKKSAETKRKSYNIELGFISKLIENKDMKLLKDLDIKSSFLTGENKRVFVYIQNSFRETGEVPTSRVLEQKFPSYELETYYKDGEVVVGTEETLQYWCKELRTKAKHNKMADAVENIAEMLKTDAYPRLRFGIGNDFQRGGQIDYVLGNFTLDQRQCLPTRIGVAVDAIKEFCLAGINNAMNTYNNK